eukprot:134170_1
MCNLNVMLKCILLTHSITMQNQASHSIGNMNPAKDKADISETSRIILSASDAASFINDYGPWIKSNPPFYRSDYGQAIGGYNDALYLIGGNSYSREVGKYDILYDNFTALPALPENVWGSSQFYTQTHNTVYMVVGNLFHAFNMNTEKFIYFWNQITLDESVGNSGCLASSNDFFFVLRNYKVQVLDLSTYKWVVGVPNMNESRSNLCCTVDTQNEHLYAIGGSGRKTVERISITDITNQQWNFTGNLMYNTKEARAVAFKTMILVIGGRIDDIYSHIEKLQVIDCLTGQVFNGGLLDWHIRYPATLLYDGIIYAFCGRYFSKNVDDWRYLDVSSGITNTPTFMPTALPTALPTNKPSFLSTNQSISPFVSHTNTVSSTISPNSDGEVGDVYTTSDGLDSKENLNKPDSHYILYLLMALAGLIIISATICGILFRKRKR